MPGMDGFMLVEKIHQNAANSGATIMMLTSAGHLGDAERCRELGISAYLFKPLRQKELFEAVSRVLRDHARPALPVPVEPQRPTRLGRARILLAEDNVVNQKLAVSLLARRGYTVQVVGDGHAALEALDLGSFDLVLMDVQMPLMDGLETAKAIRLNESGTGEHIPIIAMTAHALKGDEEKCVAAGMDAYISKPIRPDELFGKIVLLTEGVSQPAQV
jgi:CheY-like chemotaxis protein